jgi:hypothetical protein
MFRTPLMSISIEVVLALFGYVYVDFGEDFTVTPSQKGIIVCKECEV